MHRYLDQVEALENYGRGLLISCGLWQEPKPIYAALRESLKKADVNRPPTATSVLDVFDVTAKPKPGA